MQQPASQRKLAGNSDATRKAKAFRQHVQNAVSARSKGAQSPQYEKLVSELKAQRRRLEASQDQTAAEFHFIATVDALASCASTLKNGSHDVLLTAALGIPFWQCNKAVRQAVLELAVELIVVSSTFIPNCLQVFIYNLLPPPGSTILPADVRGEPWVVPEAAVEVQEQIADAIEKAVQLVPALPTRLLPMIIQSMPHKLRDRNAQCLYLRALLRLAEGKIGPAVREGILQGVVEHMLSIDADIKWEEIVDGPTGYDHEDASSEEEEEEMFEIEGDLHDLDLTGNPSSPQHQQQHHQHFAALQDGFHDPSAFGTMQRRPQGAGKQTKRPPVDETADKLDSLMEMTFEHLQRRVDAGHLPMVWQTMLNTFERTLLHAHRCKFTQYIIFFLALKDPQRCCNSFVTCLMSHLRESRHPAITRSASAAYLASFLARCAPTPTELVVDTLQKLTRASTEYAANVQQQRRALGRSSSSSSSLVLLQSAASGGNGCTDAVQRHQAFYATVQALLYILCYHMLPLLRPQQEQQNQQQQQLAAVVADLIRGQVLPLLAHQLAPLAVCHETIAAEFVRQAVLLGLADATWEAAVVDAVKQHRADAAAAVAAACAVVVGDAVNGSSGPVRRPLEMFFPFDPYLLQRSSRFLELPKSYICFQNGHPHVLNNSAAAAAAAVAPDDDGADGGSDADSELEDEQALLQHAAAVVAAGISPPTCGLQQQGDAGSDDSSSTTSDDPDTEDLSRSLADNPAAAAAAGAGAAQNPSRQASRGQHRAGVVPVGFAGVGQGSLSGLSPPADLMATSLIGGRYLASVGFSPGEAMGMSPVMNRGLIGGHSPMLDGSPMTMSYQNEGYMQNAAQLHAGVQ